MAQKNSTRTSEVEKLEAVAPTEETPVIEKITFVDYLKTHEVNPLLVASFSYEASKVPGGTDPRTEDEWTKDLETQSKRVY